MAIERESSLDEISVRSHVQNAAESVGRVWPLYADVAANPLEGFEDLSFEEAVAEGERLFGGRGYPAADRFRAAWERGAIDPDVLEERLAEHGYTQSPAALLDRMEAAEADRDDAEADPDGQLLDRLLSKWLSAFLDQGQAPWPMPNREEGFYAAWREIAPYDTEIPEASTPVARFYRERLSDVPETAMEALFAVLSEHPEDRWEPIFEHHLAALPGWTGLIKQRAEDDGNPWQDDYPITLVEYLAVRLLVAKHMGHPVDPAEMVAAETNGTDPDDDRVPAGDPPLSAVWLEAWEESYRRELIADLDRAASADGEASSEEDGGRPAAQLVFCIDTRSEIVRRHVERAGPYETHGYAGFFGVPIRYRPYESSATSDSCPVMVDPKHEITERPRPAADGDADRYDRWDRLRRTGGKLVKHLKKDVAAAFGFVEGAGGFFGAALTARTLFPRRVVSNADTPDPRPEEFCTPTVDGVPAGEAEEDHGDRDDQAALGDEITGDRDGRVVVNQGSGLPHGMTTEEKAFYAEAAFDLMGWDEFAPLVVFAGHACETVNNPYESSLDCGACAGDPGVPNARTLAAICNDDEVRSALRERGVEIAADTVFVGAEHNTTTDEITLFPGESFPDDRREELERLRADLDEAREAAAAERLERFDRGDDDPVSETDRRTADWAETRPEIGLAGNGGFVVGRRELTAGLDLGGRAFLHSYDWRTDPDGDALENVLTGPLIVTQMISAQYYFSAVDNAVYGSGSKVTQNPVGKVGVRQGNGGDLVIGLPVQSLMADDRRLYHEPLRLSVVVEAPVERVAGIVERHEDLRRLFDNGWLDLTVLDPEQDDAFVSYEPGLEWEPLETRDRAVATAVATD